MGKTIAIVQSSYIPWRGYFDLINSVDEFILYDDAQYTKRDWRNRNVIKSSNGLVLLTIPVQVKGKYFQKIRQAVVADEKWSLDHWNVIIHNYSKARHFSQYPYVRRGALSVCGKAFQVQGRVSGSKSRTCEICFGTNVDFVNLRHRVNSRPKRSCLPRTLCGQVLS